jgi:hypothetical protein
MGEKCVGQSVIGLLQSPDHQPRRDDDRWSIAIN